MRMTMKTVSILTLTREDLLVSSLSMVVMNIELAGHDNHKNNANRVKAKKNPAHYRDRALPRKMTLFPDRRRTTTSNQNQHIMISHKAKTRSD
jgi:hypothetical protein